MKPIALWMWIDEKIRYYLGIQSYSMKPKDVSLMKDCQIAVSYTEPFKRHLFKKTCTIQDLLKDELLLEEDEQKLGLAVGKAISPKLIMSFENIRLDKK